MATIRKLAQRVLKTFGLAHRDGSAKQREHPADERGRMIEIVRDNTMVAREGLEALYDQALFCEEHDVQGDLVECGVWKGGAVGLMALANLHHGRRRRHIHLFDAFEDICEPDETVDGPRAVAEAKQLSREDGTKGRLVPLKGFYDNFGGPGTIDENRRLLEETIGYDPEYLHYHKGWFQHTLPADHQQIRRIAILRLDADWYASTRICLEFFYPKVVSGGFVIIDDYGAYDGCRKAVDEYLRGLGRPMFLNRVTSEIRYLIVP